MAPSINVGSVQAACEPRDDLAKANELCQTLQQEIRGMGFRLHAQGRILQGYEREVAEKTETIETQAETIRRQAKRIEELERQLVETPVERVEPCAST